MLEEERTRSIDRKRRIDDQISNLPIEYVSARQKLLKSFGPELETLNGRITEIDAELLTLKQQTIKDEAHVGPVIFVAKTVGVSSDAAVSWFILFVVLIFDPLAIMMTLGTNHVYLMSGKRSTPAPAKDPDPTQDATTTTTTTSVPLEDTDSAPQTGSPVDNDMLSRIESKLNDVVGTVATIERRTGDDLARKALRDEVRSGAMQMSTPPDVD
jgi:hypothetical protein